MVFTGSNFETPASARPPNKRSLFRCQANSAHIRQSGPDYGAGCQVRVPTFEGVPFPLGNGSGRGRDRAHAPCVVDKRRPARLSSLTRRRAGVPHM